MKNSSTPPVYSRIAYDIAVKIASGEIKENDRFSGRSLMSSQYGVSPETIRRALRLLCDMDIVEVRKNVGVIAISCSHAIEYVEQYKSGRDLRSMKGELQEILAQRAALDVRLVDTIEQLSDMVDRFRHSDVLRTYEFTLTDHCHAVGQSIEALRFRQSTGGTVVAVRRNGEVLLSPGPQLVLEADDVLVVACDLSHLARVSEFVAAPNEQDELPPS
ncbi:MAG: TrkA C-terminal domain-containing protein [Oscillospiraceae bacterium]